ncbi:D-glycerate dehydrogenase [Micromonospora fulviviridis]|uniref:2-hydroxyacid dehydrogenase n=1 Tax=Micromonospora fulviviridis TaxID=47860 RepID=UPI0033C814BB
MTSPRFLVSHALPEPGMSMLAEAGSVEVLEVSPDSTELGRLCRSGRFDVLIAHLGDDLTAGTLEGTALKGVSLYSAGVNNVDLDTASRSGVLVANTPDVLTDATADTAILLMLAASRRCVEADRYLRDGYFRGWSPDLMLGRNIAGATLGLAGFGRIARATARRALGFGMHVQYCPRPPTDDPSSGPEHGDLEGRVTEVSWRELVTTSDVLSLHVPLAPATRHMINTSIFEAMPTGAVLVNTARGALVDEAALVEALRAGSIAAAGLDVYENEPALTPGLVELPNTVLLPHIGSATHTVRGEMARLCAANAIEMARGELPATAVNPDAWKRSPLAMEIAAADPRLLRRGSSRA